MNTTGRTSDRAERLGRAILSLEGLSVGDAFGRSEDADVLVEVGVGCREPRNPGLGQVVFRRTVETLIMPDKTPEDRQNERTEMGPAREPLRELTLGRSRPSRDPPKPRPKPDTPAGDEESDWGPLAARCRVKSEVARWAAERQRRIHERRQSPDEDAPSDPAMVAWAERLTDAFYWASTDDPAGTPDITLLDHVGGCFETVAEGLLLVRDAQEHRGGLELALPLLAEAQSALRRSLGRLKAQEDPDQAEVYERVRDAAARHRFFLKRFMRTDDLADPAGWPGLLARIERVGSRPQSERQTILLERLRTLCAPTEVERAEGSWQVIFIVLEELIGEGTPPSSREVRELLLPLLDDLLQLEDMPPGSLLVLLEIDRFLATRATPATPVTSQEHVASAREAARLLSGRSIVLIGGLRRPEAQRSLTSALGLAELVWVETREHQSIAAFEPIIARPEVALVLLAIRWSSHSFGDVKRYCDRHGKPLVRLPGGYGPNQVAAQILAQSSGQLSEEREA
jgi:hypothetical protein